MRHLTKLALILAVSATLTSCQKEDEEQFQLSLEEQKTHCPEQFGKLVAAKARLQQSKKLAMESYEMGCPPNVLPKNCDDWKNGQFRTAERKARLKKAAFLKQAQDHWKSKGLKGWILFRVLELESDDYHSANPVSAETQWLIGWGHWRYRLADYTQRFEWLAWMDQKKVRIEYKRMKSLSGRKAAIVARWLNYGSTHWDSDYTDLLISTKIPFMGRTDELVTSDPGKSKVAFTHIEKSLMLVQKDRVTLSHDGLTKYRPRIRKIAGGHLKTRHIGRIKAGLPTNLATSPTECVQN